MATKLKEIADFESRLSLNLTKAKHIKDPNDFLVTQRKKQQEREFAHKRWHSRSSSSCTFNGSKRPLTRRTTYSSKSYRSKTSNYSSSANKPSSSFPIPKRNPNTQNTPKPIVHNSAVRNTPRPSSHVVSNRLPMTARSRSESTPAIPSARTVPGATSARSTRTWRSSMFHPPSTTAASGSQHQSGWTGIEGSQLSVTSSDTKVAPFVEAMTNDEELDLDYVRQQKEAEMEANREMKFVRHFKSATFDWKDDNIKQLDQLIKERDLAIKKRDKAIADQNRKMEIENRRQKLRNRFKAQMQKNFVNSVLRQEPHSVRKLQNITENGSANTNHPQQNELTMDGEDSGNNNSDDNVQDDYGSDVKSQFPENEKTYEEILDFEIEQKLAQLRKSRKSLNSAKLKM
eukprot:gb/GECH01007009.1/.p1 GENE.gb/GECH01007009.1/~~gb/GECH01007009.1/.p1  ORF type:complete len:401 (+),score=103.42 gb/GECH01007009.1/:1-1203(+)